MKIVGTKRRKIVYTQGAELAARTKGLSAKPISEALGFLSIEGATKWSNHFFREIFLKGTSTTHVQVLCIFLTLYMFITQIKIHSPNRLFFLNFVVIISCLKNIIILNKAYIYMCVYIHIYSVYFLLLAETSIWFQNFCSSFTIFLFSLTTNSIV